MNNQNIIIHKLIAGDTLYNIAQQYKTTVDGILASNPYLNPYKLKIGDQITIYPEQNGLSANKLSLSEVELLSNMRSLWEQHVIWTRLLIISIVNNLNDLDFTTKRLLRNPKDIANIFKKYYGADVANKIGNLLTEHLVIGSNLIKALRMNDNTNAIKFNKAWYKNADDIAFALGGISPYYVEKDVREMLYNHLRLTSKEVTDRLAGNYAADVADFDEVEKQALMMADYFTNGIINQFPNSFI